MAATAQFAAPPRRAGWYKRVFAWTMSRRNARYEQAVAAHKRRLLGNLSGDVVEIGPGAGANLPFYSSAVRWVGIEPNPYMHRYLLEKAGQLGVGVQVRDGDALHLNLPDASVDAVVSTLVLCSVPDLDAVMREILRVLRPGGRFVFIEHVAAPPGTSLRHWQGRLRPLWKKIGDGCIVDRETWLHIERAGFSNVRYDRFHAPAWLAAPHIAGEATK